MDEAIFDAAKLAINHAYCPGIDHLPMILEGLLSPQREANPFQQPKYAPPHRTSNRRGKSNRKRK